MAAITATATGPDHRVLGSSPLLTTLAIWGAIFGGAITVIGLMIASGDAALMFVGILASPVLVIMLFPFARAFGSAVAGQLVHYGAARRALEQGAIDPDWAVRGSACLGIALVDEKNRRLYVNGDVFPFEDVRQVAWAAAATGSSHNTIDFMMRTGPRPFRRVVLDSGEDVMAAFARISNALDLTA